MFRTESFRLPRTDLAYSRRLSETIGHTKNLASNIRISPILEVRGLTFNISYALANTIDYSYVLSRYTKETEKNTISGSCSFVIKDVRVSPSLSLSMHQEWPGRRDPDLRPIKDLMTFTAASSFYHDTSFPYGIQIPFLKEPLPLTNRLTTNATLNYTRRISRTDMTAGNTDHATLNLTSDYTVSDNIRIGITSGLGLFLNRFRREQDNFSMNLGLRATIILM